MDQLPLEIIVHIFQFLSKKEQIKLSVLNKRFREALFTPSLWREDEKSMEVPARQMKSFSHFLKLTPWLKYLNINVSGSGIGRPPMVYLDSVFKFLNNLDCIAMQFSSCKLQTEWCVLPSALKHITILEDSVSFITDDMLHRIADSFPKMEHIEITSNIQIGVLYTDSGLAYLLKSVKGTLQTFIFSELFDYTLFKYIGSSSNLTTLCLNVDLRVYAYNEPRFALLNLENIQILSIRDVYGSFRSVSRSFSSIFMNCCLNNLRFLLLSSCYPCVNEDFYEKFTKLPNLQVLYFVDCSVDIDVLVSFVRESASIKEVAWSANGYPKEEIWKLEQLKKEKTVKIYLNLSDATPKDSHYLPRFPNEYFDCIKTFNHSMFVKILENKSPSFFKCHAPIIERSKAFLGK